MKHLMVALLIAAQGGSPIFRFETDGFWLNLHHFLYVLGRAQNRAPDMHRRAVAAAPAERDAGFKLLNERARQDWESVVQFYADGLSRRDAVFDRGLIDVTNAMRVPPNTPVASLQIDLPLRSMLTRASAIYSEVWWSRHQTENRARAREFSRLLDAHGNAVRAYVTRAYQQAWPQGGFEINVTAYANWAGAYSTDGDLIVISSLDEGTKGSLGLESMFHEAMHQWDQPMMARLSRLSKEHQTAPVRDGLVHALIWYTAAEAVKSVLPAHVGYAEAGGMWKQKQLGSFKAGLEAHWKPYLDGKGTLDEALIALLKS